MTTRIWTALACAAAVLAAGCASNPDSAAVGMARLDVLRKFGPPTATYTHRDGERLQYSRQPLGPQVFNVDLDGSGRVVSARQVMEFQEFSAIGIDVWTAADVRLAFGAPAETSQVQSFQGDVWTYRFLQSDIKRLAHIHIDRQGVVRRVLVTDELDAVWRF